MYLFDSNLVPHNDPDDYLIKSEDADEPILIYDVKKIVINEETEIPIGFQSHPSAKWLRWRMVSQLLS